MSAAKSNARFRSAQPSLLYRLSRSPLLARRMFRVHARCGRSQRQAEQDAATDVAYPMVIEIHPRERHRPDQHPADRAPPWPVFADECDQERRAEHMATWK